MPRSARFLQYSLAVLYIWFGVLKPLGLSPAADFVAQSITWFSPDWFIPTLGIGEVVIGLLFLSRKTIPLAVGLVGLHMIGTFSPFLMAPELIWSNFPHVWTIEGQYVAKNLLIIGAAWVLYDEHRKLKA